MVKGIALVIVGTLALFFSVKDGLINKHVAILKRPRWSRSQVYVDGNEATVYGLIGTLAGTCSAILGVVIILKERNNKGSDFF